jgi:hypothetical protein
MPHYEHIDKRFIKLESENNDRTMKHFDFDVDFKARFTKDKEILKHLDYSKVPEP